MRTINLPLGCCPHYQALSSTHVCTPCWFPSEKTICNVYSSTADTIHSRGPHKRPRGNKRESFIHTHEDPGSLKQGGTSWLHNLKHNIPNGEKKLHVHICTFSRVSVEMYLYQQANPAQRNPPASKCQILAPV